MIQSRLNLNQSSTEPRFECQRYLLSFPGFLFVCLCSGSQEGDSKLIHPRVFLLEMNMLAQL